MDFFVYVITLNCRHFNIDRSMFILKKKRKRRENKTPKYFCF